MTVHPNSLANLNPIKPGEVRNPEGAKPAHVQYWRYVCKYADMTEKQLKRIDPKKLKMVERSALDYVVKAAKGDLARSREFIERDIGKVPNSVAITGAEQGPLVITYEAISREDFEKETGK